MEALLAGLAETGFAGAVRQSRWLYAAVNTLHVAGIALLVGAIAPLDLRLMGCWRTVPGDMLYRVLAPVAAGGLTIAVIAGFLLFSTRAPEYAALWLFQAKIALIVTGAGSALALHRSVGRTLRRPGADAAPGMLRLAGLLSLLCWGGALVAGRMIAFVRD
ncbi:hypothetical protein [Oceanibacterium hippocampi]|uniref:DUF2214 domain-containing protein n=1 Tax=Oceanibacterium hippocampi TaxID=745714 RepID=A0A1Y5U2Z1_9PROT|nr:hypothetical protein [Oceanibacterium hippocampi]SLN75895.1 hypothetical protein OCH7691_03993 [Oceanibacterium hippocampi]